MKKKDLIGIHTYNKQYNVDILKINKIRKDNIKMYDIIVQTIHPKYVTGFLIETFNIKTDEPTDMLSLLPYYELNEEDEE